MASVIKIKRSATPGSAPSTLAAGEIAVNIPDRMLFVGDGASIYRIGAQYLSVANAVVTYQTIATERAALANTNSYIATKASWTGLTGTNTALRTLISDRLQVANSRSYMQVANVKSILANTNSYIDSKADKVNPSTSGFFNHTGRLSVGTNLAVSGNTRITGSTIIDGDLTVEGAVTYISSTTLNVDDSMIKLAANNAADTVDVGFYGKYVSSGTKYSGLFRDASDGVFKFYTGLQTEPTTTVDTGAAGYAIATVEVTLDGGTY
jgi:hypothetical protein